MLTRTGGLDPQGQGSEPQGQRLDQQGQGLEPQGQGLDLQGLETKKKTSTTLVFLKLRHYMSSKNIEIQNNTVSNHDQHSVYSTTFLAICQSKIRTSQGLYHKDKDQIHKDKDLKLVLMDKDKD